MRYFALATDYDGTLALHGRVDKPTRDALERLLASGRRLVMVTGRELEELEGVFPHLDMFDRVVAENGALLYTPGGRKEKVLGERPSEAFVDELRRRGVGPISVGRSIVATWEPHEATVVEVIRDMGLELQVIFNKGAVMILPSGVNKATGLKAALDELELSAHNAVGIGDAENDHAFLASCECGVAVENALPALKERADYVTRGDHGAGVIELVDMLLDDDLQRLEPRLARRGVLLGVDPDEREVLLPAYGRSVLLAGSSGSGKSTVATGLLERLCDQNYQFAIIDPEGDYSSLEFAVVVGTPQGAPSPQEVMELLARPHENAVINLIGIALAHRPVFFEELLPQLQALRVRAGRPHWLLVDEAHHLLPTNWDSAKSALPSQILNILFVTVHPESVSRVVLEAIDIVIAVGEAPEQTIAAFCEAIGEKPPSLASVKLERGEVLYWSRQPRGEVIRLRTPPPKAERRRHSRKYMEGDLGPDRSFYFRGPDGKLNLQAQNLVMFLQMADGVDDETWNHHLRGGDYSRWFRDFIKDETLAAETAQVEASDAADPKASRQLIRQLVEKHYTLSE